MAGLPATAVIRAHITLIKVKKDLVWEGITPASLKAIRANPDLNSTRDKLIVGLDAQRGINLCFSCKGNDGAINKWTKKLDRYFRSLIMVNHELGNFGSAVDNAPTPASARKL
jgi:hypothetical protein